MNYLFWTIFRCVNGKNPDDLSNDVVLADQENGNSIELTEKTNDRLKETDGKTNNRKTEAKTFQRIGEKQIDATTRTLWIIGSISLYVIAIVCSVIAQLAMELNGISGASLLVYVPMCITVPLSFIFLKKALPYSQKAVDMENDRIQTKGKTGCCAVL